MIEESGNRTRGRFRKFSRSMRKVEVDLNNRLQKSFGKRVEQKVEIHYRGKPLTFVYDDVIEHIPIDVVRNDPDVMADGEFHFDPTKRRMDVSDAFISCSCGAKYDVKVPTSVTGNNSEVMKAAIRRTPDILKHNEPDNGHRITLAYVETNTEVIPEKDRIKNFNPERINFYRLFSKKTAEVKYLATYGQDLLAEAPQARYAETLQGKKNIGFQNILFMLFVFGLIELFTILFVTSSTYNYVAPSHANNTAWYLLIFVVIVMFAIMWRLHIYDVSRSYVKFIMLQSAPFYISNRGVLPVIMVNSTITDVWDYQTRMMHMDDSKAKEVIYALQSWSDSQIVELEQSNKLGMLEHELTVIGNTIKYLSRVDHEYKNQSSGNKPSLKNIVFTVLITAFVYTFVLFVMGVF